MDLTNEQWGVIEAILPEDRVRTDGRGRPWSHRRIVFNGILWVCALEHLGKICLAIWPLPDGAPAFPELGARWHHRKGVVGSGRTSSFCGRDICSGQKRGRQVGKTKRGKGTKIMGVADSHGLPLALRTESASPAEVKLVAKTLDEQIMGAVPQRLIGDKAYDSDELDKDLMQHYGTAPNRENRLIPTQDGRPLRRYRRRWKIERLFAWFFNFRRLVVRYEYHAQNFQAFVHLAAALILLRHL